MDSRQDEITTLHDLCVDKKKLLRMVEENSEGLPVSVIMPMLYQEIKGDNLYNIVKGLNKCRYLDEVIIALSALNEREFVHVKRFFKKLEIPQYSAAIMGLHAGIALREGRQEDAASYFASQAAQLRKTGDFSSMTTALRQAADIYSNIGMQASAAEFYYRAAVSLKAQNKNARLSTGQVSTVETTLEPKRQEAVNGQSMDSQRAVQTVKRSHLVPSMLLCRVLLPAPVVDQPPPRKDQNPPGGGQAISWIVRGQQDCTTLTGQLCQEIGQHPGRVQVQTGIRLVQ